MQTRELVHIALLVALCAAVGYVMSGVPNVELISAAIFTSGTLQGVRRGAVIGAMAELIYAGFNPYGVSPLPLYAAQVAGMGLIGAAGGAVSPLFARQPRPLQVLLAGTAGLVLTLLYDVLTNSAIYLGARESSTWMAVVVGGLSFPFPLAHVIGNTVGFALVTPAVRSALLRRSPA
jgi:hypothetical protein